jgi:hypothetical protein
MPSAPSTLDYFELTGRNYPLIERARVLRVFTEDVTLDPERGGPEAALSVSASVIQSLLAPFIHAPAGPTPSVDPISGVPAAPFAWKLRVVTEITERNIEVPLVSTNPSLQYVPKENDYVLVCFLAGWQGVAFATWSHVGINGSYRQDRLALQRGDVALVARNALRPNATHLMLTAGGVARLAASDGAYIQFYQVPSQAVLVARNFAHRSGVHTLEIKEGRGLLRPGSYDLEVYERSIARSKTATSLIGIAANVIFGQGIAVFRLGRKRFLRGAFIIEPEFLNFDEVFLGLEEDLLPGNTDPKDRKGRVLRSFFQIDRRANLEANAGNYTPVEILEGEPPEIPETIPTVLADAKVRASSNVNIDALRSVLITAFHALQTATTIGPTVFSVGTGPTRARVRISEFGNIHLTIGETEETPTAEILIDGVLGKITLRIGSVLTQIEIDQATGQITVAAPTQINLSAPLIRIGDGLSPVTTIDSSPTSGKIILDALGGVSVLAFGAGPISVTALAGPVTVNGTVITLGAASLSALVKSTFLPLYNAHTHLDSLAGATGPPLVPSTDATTKVVGE